MKQATKEATPVHHGDWTGPGKARKKAKKSSRRQKLRQSSAATGAALSGSILSVSEITSESKGRLGYALAAEGKIHSVSLRNRGRTRGKRLFSCDSIRAYLNQCGNSNGDA